MMNYRTLSLKEYDYIYQGVNDDILNNIISQEHFLELTDFILSGNEKILKLCIHKNIKAIQTQNYVGLIQLKDGLQIEILPKIPIKDIEKSKKIFLNMLKYTLNLDFKLSGLAYLNIAEIPIFEIFINLFLDELKTIIKLGFISNYEETSKNENFLSGKLLINEHLKENYIHKEKFYIQYDIFSKNCSENKIIKSTLIIFQKISKSLKNLNDIKKILSIYFNDIEVSTNYQQDFSNCNHKNPIYRTILDLSRVFLQNRGFSNYHGNFISYGLLFPMDTLFEKYISHLIEVKNPYVLELFEISEKDYSIKFQDTSKNLFDFPTKVFNLRPDICIYQGENVIKIVDTKWKLLNLNSRKSGIFSNDMYQMITYSIRFHCSDIILCYPKIENSEGNLIYNIKDTININIKIKFIDFDKIYP